MTRVLDVLANGFAAMAMNERLTPVERAAFQGVVLTLDALRTGKTLWQLEAETVEFCAAEEAKGVALTKKARASKQRQRSAQVGRKSRTGRRVTTKRHTS
jgi:hypothetical protein